MAVEVVDREILESLIKSAEQGDANAQLVLAFGYANGANGEVDMEKSVYWFTKSAEQGNAKAQCALGVYYFNGNGVKANPEKATEWLTKAAEQGDEEAPTYLKQLDIINCNPTNAGEQFELGSRYHRGTDIPQDLGKAVYWYTKAAEQGHKDALWLLVDMYFLGNNIPKNLEKAAYWLTKLAEQGDMRAQYNLGACYDDGIGVGKDNITAARWYAKSAEQGYAGAQNNIGVCYCHGIGVPKNLKKAKYWYTKAAEQGNKDAQKNLNELAKEGCYVATCIYGSYDCPEVWTLRRYRDSRLSNSWFGRLFIRIYYAMSPKIVELFGNRKWFNGICKPLLNKIVRKLQNSGIVSGPYSDM